MTDEGRGNLRGRRVAVTGATGFIGSRVVDACLASGAEVTAILRTGHGARVLSDKGARVRTARLEDAAAVAAALTGTDILIHLAYDMRAGGIANLRTFDGVLNGARQAGVERMVHLSSAVVHAAWPEGHIDEASAITDDAAETYRGAKAEMERRLAASGLAATILRPTIVWGSGSVLWTDMPMRWLRTGGIVLPDPPGIAPLVHVDDLVAAICAAAAQEQAGCRAYLVNGAEHATWRDLFEGYRRIAGQGEVIMRPAGDIAAGFAPPGPPRGPSAAARVSAFARRLLGRQRFEAIVDRVSRLRRTTGPVWPDRDRFALYSASPEIDIRAARQDLGFRPRVGLQAGLDEIREQSLRR